MNDDLLNFFTRSLITALIAFGGAGGAVGWLNAHRSKKAGIKSDDREARRERTTDLESGYTRVKDERDRLAIDNKDKDVIIRLQADYIRTLRRSHPDPDPYPDNLTQR